MRAKHEKSSENTTKELALWADAPEPAKPKPEPPSKPAEPALPDGRVCSVPGCGRKHSGKGLCNPHYAKLYRTKEIRICSVPGCDKKYYSANLCIAHYKRQRKGNLQQNIPIRDANKIGANNPKWRGGQIIYPDKRVAIYAPEHPAATKMGYVFRYRLVMEKVLGRFLTDEEIVHHINEITNDDRPENLQVMTQSEHAKLHNFGRNKHNARIHF